MKTRSVLYAVALVCAAIAPSFAHHTAVIVNKGNVIEKITSAQLTKIIRGEVKKWSDGKNIILVLHKDSAGEREALEHLNKMTASEWRTFVAAHRETIIFVDTDAEVLKAVQSEPGAVGLIEVHSLDSSVNVVRIDGRLPLEAGYLPH